MLSSAKIEQGIPTTGAENTLLVATNRAQSYIDTLLNQAANTDEINLDQTSATNARYLNQAALDQIGKADVLFDGKTSLSPQSYEAAIKLGLCDSTQVISNAFARKFQQAVTKNVVSSIGIAETSPESMINQTIPFLEACTNIAVNLVNSEKPDLILHRNLAKAVGWFQKIDRRQRHQMPKTGNLPKNLGAQAVAVEASFELLTEIAPQIDDDVYQEARIKYGRDIQTSVADNYQNPEVCPEFAKMIKAVEKMSSMTQIKDKDLLSVVETGDSLNDPATHIATTALFCVHALDVRRNLSDAAYPNWRVFRSVVETLPNGARTIFCRVRSPNKAKDDELEMHMQRAITSVKQDIAASMPAKDPQTPELERKNLPKPAPDLDLEIRGSTAAIADNTEYQIEPDDNLRLAGISQIGIQMVGNEYIVNIISESGPATIRLSPDDLSGLVTNIESTTATIDPAFLEHLAKLALAKTKQWIADQYRYCEVEAQSSPTGMKIAKRSPHLELLPLGHQNRQYNHEGYAAKMTEKFGTTPAELNDCLIGAQRGTIGLSEIPPHIRKMIEDLIFRAEIRGYDMKWVDRDNTQSLIAGNPPRITKSGKEVPYDPTVHALQVSFVPGIDDGQKRQVMLKLEFPELAPATNTLQSGTVYTSI